jgi:xanthine dehydrogenase YagS FAD-binding subunit
MRPYSFVSAQDEGRATAAAKDSAASYIAGGTTLVDLMRLDVLKPSALIDITHLTLGRIEVDAERVRVGALVRNSDLAHHPVVRERLPVLSEALLSGASPQIRNMATLGGNLLQRTRCSYFRDVASACNKRAPGAGCSAISGYSRMHAVLGGSDRCIAVNPSDMNVALVALDAVVRAKDAAGATREIPIADFHMLPADHAFDARAVN